MCQRTDIQENPAGSSSGSAVAVSAGYAPLSIGTETDGSLVVPANRAAVYTIKPTIGTVSQDGLIPVSHTMDSAGPMATAPYDLALLLDVLQEDNPARESYTSALADSWSDLSIAAVNCEEWIFPPEFMKPNKDATHQMVCSMETHRMPLKVNFAAIDARIPGRL